MASRAACASEGLEGRLGRLRGARLEDLRLGGEGLVQRALGLVRGVEAVAEAAALGSEDLDLLGELRVLAARDAQRVVRVRTLAERLAEVLQRALETAAACVWGGTGRGGSRFRGLDGLMVSWFHDLWTCGLLVDSSLAPR